MISSSVIQFLVMFGRIKSEAELRIKPKQTTQRRPTAYHKTETMLLHKAFKLSALLGTLTAAADASLTAVPSAGVNILEEVDGQGGFSDESKLFQMFPSILTIISAAVRLLQVHR